MNNRILLAATITATFTACSSMPDRNAALDDARSRYNSAQNDPQVAALAPIELKNAGDSLRVADKAWTDRSNTVTVDHLAYMTNQRVTIAQETASSKAAEAITAGAAAERDRLRLASRTNEANLAQQKLAASQQSNAEKAAALANAESAAAATAAATALREQANAARLNDLEMQLQEINAKKTERGMVVTLGDVLFDTGQSRLVAAGAPNIIKLADFFKRNPQRTASIEGFTDSTGNANANYDLSGRRANAVMTALVNLGVPADRLNTRAHGADHPTADNATAAGRQLNRRVEIIIAQ